MGERSRPVQYTEDLADRVCYLISGGMSIREVVESDPDTMPAGETIFRWIGKYPDFSQKYMRAQAERAHKLVEETIDISDDKSIGSDHKRVMVDTRKWYASKFMPKVFGEHVKHELTGPDGGPVEFTQVKRVIVDPAKPADAVSEEKST